MKKVLTILATIMTLGFLSEAAWAIAITDVVTFNNTYLNGSDNDTTNDYKTYTHDILDNGFSIGDTITSASITFKISDNESGYDGWFLCWNYDELVSLTADGTSIVKSFEIDNGSTVNLVSAISKLQADGQLNITLTCTYGDFYLNTSTLNVVYTDNTPTSSSPVPEPTTLFLIGSGLLAMAGFKKRI